LVTLIFCEIAAMWIHSLFIWIEYDVNDVKKVHNGIPAGKRNRGRPLKRWRDALD